MDDKKPKTNTVLEVQSIRVVPTVMWTRPKKEKKEHGEIHKR